MPEFGVVAEHLADQATRLSGLADALQEATSGLSGTADAAQETGAAGACESFVSEAGRLLTQCVPALDGLTISLATAAEAYQRVDQSVIGG